MPSQNRTIRHELRASLDEVCEAMRAHKRAVDRTITEFNRCARQSRESLISSQQTLARIVRRAADKTD